MTDIFPPPRGGHLGDSPISGYPITTWVVIDGVKVPCTADELGLGQPTVLDGLSFSWGRDTTIDQPDTNTCAFILREQIEPDTITTTDLIHVGSSIEVWSQADVPPDDGGEVMDRNMWKSAGPLDVYTYTKISGDTPSTVSFYPGVNESANIWLQKDGDWDWSTILAFPPRRFDDGTHPTAWDLVPRIVADDIWKASVNVLMPPGSTATLHAYAYSGPTKSNRVGEATVTGTSKAATGATSQMIDGMEWMTISGDVSLPSTLDDPAGYWLAIGVEFNPMPSPLTWADTPGTWDDQVLTWLQLQQARLQPPSLQRGTAAVRTVLVWSGEVTNLATQAVGYKAITTSVTATDLASILANAKVGDEPWLSQTVQQRADAIMALIPTAPPLIIDPGLQSTMVSYRDVDKQPPLGLLQDLAQTAGGVLWITAHATQGAYLWMEDPRQREAVRRFAIDPDTGAVYITNDDGDLIGRVAVISAMDVLNDPVTWTQDVSSVITQATITWLEQLTDDDGLPTTEDQTVVVPDTAERIERYGIRDVSVSTELISAADAQELAARILALSAGTGWKLDGLEMDTILLEREIGSVSYGTRLTTTLDLLDATVRIGYPVTLVDMPGWTPDGAVRNVYVDGGTYRWEDWRWHLELTATPAAGQGISARWQDFAGTGVTWEDFRPNKIKWTDAYGTSGPNMTQGVTNA